MKLLGVSSVSVKCNLLRFLLGRLVQMGLENPL